MSVVRALAAMSRWVSPDIERKLAGRVFRWLLDRDSSTKPTLPMESGKVWRRLNDRLRLVSAPRAEKKSGSIPVRLRPDDFHSYNAVKEPKAPGRRPVISVFPEMFTSVRSDMPASDGGRVPGEHGPRTNE